MLGRLAKWLRILGFDTAYLRKAGDDELLGISRRENRVFLTRDSGLIEKNGRRSGRLFIKSDDWEEQVVQVLDEFGLRDQVKLNSRCVVCNVELKRLSKAKATNLVTPYVLEHGSDFAICPKCGRVFWRGTHSGDMESRLESILGKRKKDERRQK